jgi:hypothetical protein
MSSPRTSIATNDDMSLDTETTTYLESEMKILSMWHHTSRPSFIPWLISEHTLESIGLNI